MRRKERAPVKRLLLCLLAGLLSIGLSGCGKRRAAEKQEASAREEKPQIGISFDSFVIERWQRDRDAFVARASGELGAEVNVQNAGGDVEKQISQIDYLIEKGMDVIVIVATDGERLGASVARAKRAGIKVIAYDRMIPGADVDLYITFDNERVGEMMAESILENTSEGSRIFMMCGSPTDNNVSLVNKGFEETIARADREIVGQAYADNWLAELGFVAIEEYLASGGELDAVMCGNDDVASQVIKALSENRLAGEVCVVGQDAELGACQRIVEGTQTMTVYKPIERLAGRAAECAVQLARGEEIKAPAFYEDGDSLIPYIGLEPTAVTENNMQVVIDDGYHVEEDIYLNVGGLEELKSDS